MTHDMDDMLAMLQKYLVFDLVEHFGDIRFRDENNLIQVMKDIYAKTKRSFVILIDEWDCLFREYQQDQNAQKKYLDFLCGQKLLQQTYVYGNKGRPANLYRLTAAGEAALHRQKQD